MHRTLLRAALILASSLAVHADAAPTDEISPVSRRAFGGVQPRVSPDGRWIAMSYQGAIARMPADGGVLTVLTHGEGWDIDPAWSPDGKQIAFVSSPSFQSGTLAIAAADNGKLLTPAKAVRAQGPLWWHPDGKRVLGRFGEAGAPARVAWVDTVTGEVKPVEGVPSTGTRSSAPRSGGT